MQLTGLHHVTAITGQAARNVHFYTRDLGLRLVKKTVNQDDVSSYHFFYADALGSAGTEVTFFDWPHAYPHRAGTGSISEIALRVNGAETLQWWQARCVELGLQHSPIEKIAGRTALRLRDPEGQSLRLVDDGGAPGGTPWEQGGIPAAHTIRGLDAVNLTVQRLAPTAAVLVDILGFARTGEYRAPEGHEVVVFETGAGGPGTQVHVAERRDLPATVDGAGGVHHVAFRTPDLSEQLEWRARIVRAGLGASNVIDRYYFKSLYFREPNGILFEIATDGPGFATDEDPARLGERLALPPFLEPQRALIEAGLKPIQ